MITSSSLPSSYRHLFCEMFTSEDIGLAGGGDEYVTPVTAILDGGHLLCHGSWQGVDLVHFNDDHPAAEAPEGLSRALADKEGVGVLVNHFDVLLFGNLILVAIPDISSLFRITARSI